MIRVLLLGVRIEALLVLAGHEPLRTLLVCLAS